MGKLIWGLIISVQTRYEPLGIGSGTLIAGRYEIERSVGSGGMAAVFRVIDRALNNQVCALKIFEPRLTKGEVDLERFRNEVLVTRKLTHNNIVRSYEFGQTPTGQFFLTMEYISGKSLHDLIYSDEYKTLSFSQMIRYLVDICKAISYSHSVGVIHRDIKPANILITNNGVVKVTDFGLAQKIEAAYRLTQTGECVGTPAYMPPEQLQGKVVDEKADIYAIGILAFELVCGCLPYAAPDLFSLASKIMTEPLPQLTSRKVQVPAWFQGFITKATAKNIGDRFETAEEMAALLESHLSETQEILVTRRGMTQQQRDGVDWVVSGLSSKLYRYAPLIAAGSAVLMLLITIVGTSENSVEDVKATVQDGSTAIDKFADTLNKLNHAVTETYNNREKIDKFLQAQGENKSLPGIAETTEQSNLPNVENDISLPGDTGPDQNTPDQDTSEQQQVLGSTKAAELSDTVQAGRSNSPRTNQLEDEIADSAQPSANNPLESPEPGN